MHPNVKYAKQVICLIENLNDIVCRAGGIPFTTQDLQETTLFTFLCKMAPNGIRFTLENKDGR